MFSNFSLRIWQAVTVLLLVLGYSAYYLCRSNLSVSLPSIAQELVDRGIADSTQAAMVMLGIVLSCGTAAYAFGKFFGGILTDYVGGKVSFLVGMGGAVVFTVLFGFVGTVPLFTLAWVGNRLLQSLGWGGMVKIASRWFPYTMYGTIMGLISLSYLFGDAAARQFISVLQDDNNKMGWRDIFLACAAVPAALFLVSIFLIRETPARLGLPEPESAELLAAPANRPRIIRLLSNRAFWYVCLLSLSLTLLREIFTIWLPTYYQQVLGMTESNASSASARFPLFGGIAVIVFGIAADLFGRPGRAMMIAGGMLVSSVVLLILGTTTFPSEAISAVSLMSVLAFFLIGPYSYLAGAIALDFGGKDSSGSSAGFIDGVGYLGGILAGFGSAKLLGQFGGVQTAEAWSKLYLILAIVAFVSVVPAYFFYLVQRDKAGIDFRNDRAGNPLPSSMTTANPPPPAGESPRE